MTDDFHNWIGRRETSAPDTITPRLTAAFAAMLGPHLAAVKGTAPGLHWCLAPPIIAASDIGPDGHARLGGFLPPLPLPRRMWAGGDLSFLAPLHEGDSVTRTSEITGLNWKQGRSGPLCFVTVTHEISTQRGPAIREAHHIVYRPAATSPAAAATPAPAQPFDSNTEVHIDEVLLFRYSALTFNSHRIHYDLPYARTQEHYPGLVIHGPLQATLMLNLATRHAGQTPHHFSFRARHAATGTQTLRIGLRQTSSGVSLAVHDESGIETMTGSADWTD